MLRAPQAWETLLTFGDIGRCTLSFLAIMEPNISKYCESCEAEYLDETRFDQAAGDVDAGDEITSTSQLELPCDVRDLFRSAPVCILCGGKFMSYSG